MSKRHLPFSSTLSSHRMVSRKGARLELADVISFRDQRTTYIVNCSHFRPPSLCSPPSASVSLLPSLSLPPALSVAWCVRERLRAHIMLPVKLRQAEHGSLCPFKRSRVSGCSTGRRHNVLNRLATKLFIVMPFYGEIVVTRDFNGEIEQLYCM